MPFSPQARARLEADAAQIIARYPRSRSALLPLLYLVQAEEGYVSTDGIAFCADRLHSPYVLTVKAMLECPSCRRTQSIGAPRSSVSLANVCRSEWKSRSRPCSPARWIPARVIAP